MRSLTWLLDPQLYLYALITGVAIAIVCSVLSVVVVLKRMAFIGQGISHAGFGGLGIAIFFGIYEGLLQDLIVLAFCLAAAVLIGVLSRRRRVEADSAIGIILVAAIAAGVLLSDWSASLRREGVEWYRQLVGPVTTQPPSFDRLLFGSLASVMQPQMIAALVVCAGVLLTLGLLYKEVLFFAFDEGAAKVFGVRTRVIYYLLLLLLSLTIVVSIKLVGVVLASALLVIPGAAAVQLSRRFLVVLAWAVLIGLTGVVGGLVLSLEAGHLSSGAAIVAVLCVIFAGVYAWRG